MAELDDLLQDAARRMDRSVEATRIEFNSVRTGRAAPALLDRIQVDYYGRDAVQADGDDQRRPSRGC